MDAGQKLSYGGDGWRSGGRLVVRHSRQVVFQMAEVAVPRELFRAILEKIESLRMPATASG